MCLKLDNKHLDKQIVTKTQKKSSAQKVVNKRKVAPENYSFFFKYNGRTDIQTRVTSV